MDKKDFSLPKKSVSLKKKNTGLTEPDFDSLLDSSGLPGLPDNDETDPEKVVNTETDNMLAMLRENRKNNAERFRDVDAGEFWFCVCFQSRSQKEDFIKQLLEKYSPGDTPERFGNKYVSGLELAEILGIQIERIALEVKQNRLAPKAFRRMEVI